MIGVIEIVFAVICFLIMWFFIFKLMLKIEVKKILKNMPNKLEEQEKKFFVKGKEIDLKKTLGLQKVEKEVVKEVEKVEKVEKTTEFVPLSKRGKKEDENKD